MGVFSSKQKRPKAGVVTEADKAVLSLKTQRRKLSAERARLEGLIAKGIEDAKQYIKAKRRERALLILRKNKLYENNVDKIDAYLLNVEQILANIETAQRTNRLLGALKEGNAALAQLQKEVTLEDVEKLNDDTAEAKEYQDQVRELLGQSLSAQDDAEALEELEKLQAVQEQEEARRLPAVPSLPPKGEEAPAAESLDLPDVPTHAVEMPAKAENGALKRGRMEEPMAA